MKRNLNISIAGIHGRIVMEDTILYNELKKKFATYESGKPPGFKLFISGSFSDLKKDNNPHHPVVIESSKEKIAVVEYMNKNKKDILGYIDSTTQQCYIAPAHELNYSRLFSSIRACYHYFLEKNGGFFLHASSGTINGKTFAFTGKSDSGKTTALRNMKPDAIVAQDAAAIRIHGKRPQVFAVPFRNDSNAMGEADAVFFPKKTKEKTKIVKKGLAQSITEITSNTLFASPCDPTLINNVMETIIKFCMTVPAFNLYFKKDDNLQTLPELIA